MNALRWYARKDVRYEDVPEPKPAPGQVKVKVKFAGICGSDLREYFAGPCLISPAKAPVTLGHEFSGTVTELGKGVTDFNIGDRVSGLGYWPCGKCYFCQRMQYNLCTQHGFSGLSENGSMAEYFVAPSLSFFKLPDTVSNEDGALIEPLSVAAHALRQGNVRLGNSVAIIGDGTIGLAMLLFARAAGADPVYLIYKHRSRGKKAQQMGATAVFDTNKDQPLKQIIGLTGGLGVDVAFECVGYPETAQLAVDLARRGGTTVMVGVFDKPGQFNFASMTFSEKTIVGSSIYVREAESAIALLADRRIETDGIVTSIVPLKDAIKLGFESLNRDKENNIKVLLKV